MRGQEGRKKMPYLEESYDIVVVGAGHAGCEAALACARLGLETIMFTVSVDSIALMPCNPNIGGSSKGHLVRELDALGGEMGKNIDKTFIQSKMLNESKGPAVHSLRAQADKQAYTQAMRQTLEQVLDRTPDHTPGRGIGADCKRGRCKRRKDLFRRCIPRKGGRFVYRHLSAGQMHLRGCKQSYRA